MVLAPLGGISLLWNSLLAHVILGEGFSNSMMVGTVLIATGAVLIAIYGVVPDGNHSLDELLALWKRPAFVAFFSVVCLLVVTVLVVAHIGVWRAGRSANDGIYLPADDAVESEPPSNYASPCSTAAIPFRPTAPQHMDSSPSIHSALHSKVVRFASILDDSDGFEGGTAAEPHRVLTLCGLAFAAASGTLSGLCLVLAKGSVELVISTIDYWRTGRGQNEFARPETWFLVAGLAVAAILQLVYLNYSLTFASPALICPLAFCFFNLASIFDGLVFYDQLGRLATHQVILVSLGVVILLLGVWIVSAIQPGGHIEVGTWVEDEMDDDVSVLVAEPDELEAGEGATLLGSNGDEAHLHHEPLELGLDPSHSPPPSPLIESPLSPTQRRRRPRYGTLIPELGSTSHPAMPTGFAFGIGAASPGFALRSNSINHGHGRRGSVSSRSRSNSHSASVAPVVIGRRVSDEHLGLSGVAPIWEEEGSGVRRGRVRPLSLPTAPSPGMLASAPPLDSVEHALADWDTPRERERDRWFRWPVSLWRREGQVKLPEA